MLKISKWFITMCVIIPLYAMATTTSDIVSPPTVLEKIKYYSNKYDVSFLLMYKTVQCETAGTFDPKIQSKVIYNFSSPKRGIVKGEREQSYGLAQIHIPDNDVTIEQATDPDFALDFMAKHLSEGHHKMWSCIKGV